MNLDVRRGPPAVLGWIVGASATSLAAAALFLLVTHQDQMVEAVGVLRPTGDVIQVASESAGRVTAVHAWPGQRVRAGDTLFQLDDTTLRQQREAAQQLLATQEVQLEAVGKMIELASAQSRASVEARSLEAAVAEDALHRTRELVRKGIESQSELQRSSGRMKIAKKELEVETKSGQVRSKDLQARQAEYLKMAGDIRTRLGVLDHDLQKTTIRAPADGQITWIRVHNPGEWTPTGTTIARIVPAGSNPVFVARVSNEAIGRVAIGQIARLDIDAFPSNRYGYLHGKVVDVAPDADGDHHDYTVVIALQKKFETPMLKIGMTGRVGIVTGRQRLITHLAGR